MKRNISNDICVSKKNTGNDTREIRRKRLRDLKSNVTIAIVGGRGRGKSTLIRNLLYYNYKKIRIPLLISGTASLNNDFAGMIPELCVHDKYKPEKINALIKDQAILKTKILKGLCSPNVKKIAYLIMDDIIGTDTIWKKDSSFARIFYAGRHFWFTNIIAVQNPISIPPGFRENIDYFITTSVSTEKRKKHIFEHFWNDRFGDYNYFKGLLHKITNKDHYCMLLDNKNNAKCLSKYVYWVKGTHPLKIPKKKIGLKYLWELNKKYYNPNHVINRISDGLDNKIYRGSNKVIQLKKDMSKIVLVD